MRKKFLVTGAFLISMLATASLTLADTYSGWTDEIQPALADGEGSEFVTSITGLGPHEFSGILEAFGWVVGSITYVEDDVRFGEPEVWVSANQTYDDMVGDCEDQAILLCALLRFHTLGGIPSDYVWVAAGRAPGGGLHAWVQINLPRLRVSLDPTANLIKRGSLGGAKLRFNDAWVEPKGVKYWPHV